MLDEADPVIREAAMGLPEVVPVPTPTVQSASQASTHSNEIAELRQRITLLEEALRSSEEQAKEWEAKHGQLAKELRAERDYHRQQLEGLASHIPHAASLARRVGRGLPWIPPKNDE